MENIALNDYEIYDYITDDSLKIKLFGDTEVINGGMKSISIPYMEDFSMIHLTSSPFKPQLYCLST